MTCEEPAVISQVQGRAGLPGRALGFLVPRPSRHCHPAGDARALVPTGLHTGVWCLD